MEKKVMNQPQSEKAIMNRGNAKEDINYWITYVNNHASLVSNNVIAEELSIISQILDKLNDKIKNLEDKQRLMENNYITMNYGTS